MPSDGKSSHCLWQGELKKKYLNLPWIAIDEYHLCVHGI